MPPEATGRGGRRLSDRGFAVDRPGIDHSIHGFHSLSSPNSIDQGLVLTVAGQARWDVSSGFVDLSAQAHQLVAAGDLAAAQELLADSLASADPRPAYASSELTEAAGLYARVLVALGEPHSARGWAAFTYSAATRLYGPNDARTVAAAATLAAVLHRVGNYARAARLYQEVIIELTATDGPESLRVLAAHADLATVEYAQGDCSVARSRLQDAWELHREIYGDGHPSGIKMLARLGGMQRDCGRFTEAHESLALARDLCRGHLPADDPLATQVAALARAAANPDHVCTPLPHDDESVPDELAETPPPEGSHQPEQPVWPDGAGPPAWPDGADQTPWRGSADQPPWREAAPRHGWSDTQHHQGWDGVPPPRSGWDESADHRGYHASDQPAGAGTHHDHAGWNGPEQTGGRPPPPGPYASPLPPDVPLPSGPATNGDGRPAPGGGWQGGSGVYTYRSDAGGDLDDPDGVRRVGHLPARRGNRLPVRVHHPHRRRGNRMTPLVVAGVVVVLLGATAVVVGVAAVDSPGPITPQPPPTPAGTAPGVPTPTGTVPTARAAASDFLPPAGVALRDGADTVTLSWRYPQGANGPVVISGGRSGQQAWAIEQLPAGTVEYVVRGLNRAFDYCFTVAVVYSVDTVSRAEPVCTGRHH